MTGNDNLFDDADVAPERPAPASETGSFNLAGLFDSADPVAADAPTTLPAFPAPVQRPKPVRPIRADGSIGAARRAVETTSAFADEPVVAEPVAELREAREPREPLEPLTQPDAQPSAPPTLTEPLQWLTPSKLAGASPEVGEPRPSDDEVEPSAPSSLGGLVKQEALATVDAERVAAAPVVTWAEAPVVGSAVTPAGETALRDEVQWAPRSTPVAPAASAEPVAPSAVNDEPRVAVAKPAERMGPPRASALSKQSRFAMTGKDWTIAIVSLGITAAAIAGIFALL